MEVIKMALGDMQTNCYMMINKQNECVVVDPGDESQKVIQLLDEKELRLKAILITHGHFDHIGGVDELQAHYGVDVYAHQVEAEMMSDAALNLSAMFFGKTIVGKANKYLVNGEILDLGNDLKFMIIEVPGHTSHSLCYLHADGQLFSGDTLFNASVGRTDLYDGDPRDLVANIRKSLFTLDGGLIVYPGHGLTTTIQNERDTNPFLMN